MIKEKSIVGRLKKLLADEEEQLKKVYEPHQRQTQARTVLMFLSELRKAESSAARHAARVTRPQVIAWARTLDAEEQRSVAQEIVALSERRSVLA
jgi:hypothetical protein